MLSRRPSEVFAAEIRFTANPKVREEPFANVTLDLSNRSRGIDRLYVVGQTGGAGKNIVEPAPPIYSRLYLLRIALAPKPP